MAYLHEQGYPVPAIEELSDDGLELVMERIEGRSMVDAIAAAPWTPPSAGEDPGRAAPPAP